jgi:glycosyltransferase involved in cell wall biosynthesis
LEMPQYFPPFMMAMTSKWLEAVLQTADVVACISRTTAEAVRTYAPSVLPDLGRPISIGSFVLGADLAGSAPTKGLSDDDAHALKKMEERPTVLMVGTIEPRKGYDQALAAFDILWKRNVDVALTIVGKKGWMVDDIAGGIRLRREFGNKLVWLESASDEMLEKAYGKAAFLLSASHGEGFGLPIVEAARHGIPVIARDLAVFREITGEDSIYFAGPEPERLAEVVQTALAMPANARKTPSSDDDTLFTWKRSWQQLWKIVMGQMTHFAIGEISAETAPSTREPADEAND